MRRRFKTDILILVRLRIVVVPLHAYPVKHESISISVFYIYMLTNIQQEEKTNENQARLNVTEARRKLKGLIVMIEYWCFSTRI